MNNRNKIKSIIFLAASMMFQFNADAQQVSLLSNYNADKFISTPAYVSSVDGLNVSFINRAQWTGFDGAPKTQFADIYGPILRSNFGIGLSFLNDAAGGLNNMNFQLAPSYKIKLNKSNSLNVGFGFNYQLMELDNSAIENVDPTDVVLEQYLDGFGNIYMNPSLYFENNKINFGISVPQFSNNNFIVNDNNALLDFSRRHVLATAGYNYEINDRWTFQPSILARFEKAAPVNYDINAMITYNESVSLNLGYRNSGMFITGLAVSFSEVFNIGYSHDATLNRTANDKGLSSHEFFATYSQKNKKCCNNKKVETAKPVNMKKDNIEIFNNEQKEEVEIISVPVIEKKVFSQKVESKIKDADGDGVRDEFDNCPTEKGKISNFGCPDSGLDSDGDSIKDVDDLCPFNFGTIANKGCPQ